MLRHSFSLQCCSALARGFSNNTKSIAGSNELFSYCDKMSSQLPEILRQLQSDTELNLSNFRMMTPASILKLNMMLCRGMRAKKVLDVGVYTGSSSLAACLATDEDARIFALEKSRKYSDIAQKYWNEAGVEHKIKLMLGDALQSLDTLIKEGHQASFDFTYIDADKIKYIEYFERSVQLTRQGGIIAVDNTLFRGQVIESEHSSKTSQVINAFNEHLKTRKDVEVVLLPIEDGYTITSKI